MNEELNKVFFPGSSEFLNRAFSESHSIERQFSNIFQDIINLIELSSEIFIVCTVRCYETEILNDSDKYRKKIKPIKETLKDKFKSPSLGTILALQRQCFYLIDDKAPEDLLNMRNCFTNNFTLGAVGLLLNDLNSIYSLLSEGEDSVKKTYTEISKKNMFELFDEFAKFRNDDAHLRRIREIIEDNYVSLNLNIHIWRRALSEIMHNISPLLSTTYRSNAISNIDISSIGKSDDRNDIRYIRKSTKYENGNIDTSESIISNQEYNDNPVYSNEIVMLHNNKEFLINVEPFLFIKNGRLYHYKRMKPKYYEYYSICDETINKLSTKKKFNHYLFRTQDAGDQQRMFWADVPPTFNETQTIKANIPMEQNVVFVGRANYLKRIREEIIEIPNENGAIYGPGGVGKTALMIELSKKLFSESPSENVLFANIIWCSAKKTYYNPSFNVTELKEKQFESLDSVFSLILRFFDYEDIADYSFEEKKELVLELLEENTVLLILDNFESLSKDESERIVKFINNDAKKHLKKYPFNFKSIITSRESIPTTFRPIKLKGLSESDTKKLIKKLFEFYKDSHEPLNDEQMEKLYNVTHGIPIVIKHCIGQLFEHNVPLDTIIIRLGVAENEVIKFSFEEIFHLLKNNRLINELFILLDLIKRPISIRQMSDILGADEHIVGSNLQKLLNFHCIERINQGSEEKFSINESVDLLVKTLVQEENEMANEIKKKIYDNFSIDKQMDYSPEEKQIRDIFTSYLENDNLSEAEAFIQIQLSKHPDSIILKYLYARYLKEIRNEIEKAISILEPIHKENLVNHIFDPGLLLLLASCYTNLDKPSFEKAHILFSELESHGINSDELEFEIGHFYLQWSEHLKFKREIDHLSENIRIMKYRELAVKAINKLERIEKKYYGHNYYYLLAKAYFNNWNNEKASSLINEAIFLAHDKIAKEVYINFKKCLSRPKDFEY
jgi:hypothetical protein